MRAGGEPKNALAMPATLPISCPMSFMMILVAIAMVITLGVLFTGLFSMARGGEFNARYGNRLMRARIVAQVVALVLFAVAVLTSSR